MFKEFIKSHSGETEIFSESSPSKWIEKFKIKRDLKVPTIDQFDGYANYADFIHLFDGLMAFYGTSRRA